MNHIKGSALLLSYFWLFCDTMDCSPPSSSVHVISQAWIWSGLSFPAPGDLPNPEIEPASLVSLALEGRFFTASTTWEAPIETYHVDNLHFWKSALITLWRIIWKWASLMTKKLYFNDRKKIMVKLSKNQLLPWCN